MFSFKTLYVRFSRLLPTLLVTLGVLLLVEIAFRANNWFYDYDGWESPALQKKMVGADKLFEERGRIDLVTLSTSIGRVWDVNQWEEATSGAITAYNFGYPDQRPERQNFLFQKHIYPRFKPGYVIYGVGAGDCNSNKSGMHPERPKSGAFWSYRNITALDANSVFEKAEVFFENRSALYKSRRRARFQLQYGELLMLPRQPTISNGVLAPTVRRQPFGPMELSWALTPEGLPYNDFHDYWIPDDGEIGELLKLHKFCEKHDVELVIVEFPTSPYSYTNFDNPEYDYWRFLNALDYLESKGATVLRMGQELNLDNTYYEDQAHMNRWGGQVVTDYIYRKVIREWFPDAALAEALPGPVEIALADVISTESTTASTMPTGAGEETLLGTAAEIRRAVPATDEAQYAADLQVFVSQPVDIELTGTLAAESYAVEVYGGDGSTTTPERTGEAVLHLVAVDEAGDEIRVLPLEWINTRVGISYTMAHFTMDRPGRLLLRVAEIGPRPVILDSVFIRPRLSALGPDGIVSLD